MVKYGTTFAIGKNIFGTYLYPMTSPIGRNTLCAFLARRSGYCEDFSEISLNKGLTEKLTNKRIEKGKVYILPYDKIHAYTNNCWRNISHKVDSDLNETCEKCHWVICGICNSCGCGYPDSKDNFNFEVKDLTGKILEPFDENYVDLSMEINNAMRYIEFFRSSCSGDMTRQMKFYTDVLELLFKHENISVTIFIERSALDNPNSNTVFFEDEIGKPIEPVVPRIYIPSGFRNPVMKMIKSELLHEWLK